MTSEKINVAEIINDINDVLSKHLVSIVNKCNNDKEQYENYILNIPVVKKIIDENNSLKNTISVLEEKNRFLNNNLSSLSQKYTELFFKVNKLKVSANISSLNINENRLEISNDKNNIELEVNDKSSDCEEINQKDIEQEIENTIKEKQKKMIQIDVNLDNDHDISTEPINLFDVLQNDSEDDEEEEDDSKEDDEEEEDDSKEDDEEEDEEEEDDEDEEDESKEDDEDDEDDEEVEEFEYDGVTYYGSEKKVGNIYGILEDEDIGEVVGHFVNGEPIIF